MPTRMRPFSDLAHSCSREYRRSSGYSTSLLLFSSAVPVTVLPPPDRTFDGSSGEELRVTLLLQHASFRERVANVDRVQTGREVVLDDPDGVAEPTPDQEDIAERSARVPPGDPGDRRHQRERGELPDPTHLDADLRRPPEQRRAAEQDGDVPNEDQERRPEGEDAGDREREQAGARSRAGRRPDRGCARARSPDRFASPRSRRPNRC